MSESPVRFKYSLREGVLELEGSEEFVSKTLAEYAHLLRAPASIPPAPTTPQAPRGAGHPPAAASNAQDNPSQLDAYDKVYSLHDGTLKLICNLPGGSNAEKTQKAALLWLLGEKLRGNDSAALDDVRSVCRDHGCFDSANFSTTIKKLKSQVTLAGGRAGTARLTKPGENEARSLANELQAK